MTTLPDVPARLAPALLVAALLLSTTVGCSPTPSPPPTPTPTPLFATEEEAFAAAEDVYREYIAAFNAIDLGNPDSFETVAEYTAGRYEAEERKDLSSMHAEGYTRSGNIEILKVTHERVDDDGTIYLRTCNDVSATIVRDSSGRSLVPADRPHTFAVLLRFTVTDGTPLLIESESVQDPTCAPS